MLLHIITCLNILLHLITYYYMLFLFISFLFHIITYYYILLQIGTYYYRLVHISTYYSYIITIVITTIFQWLICYLMKTQPGTAAPGQAAESCGPKEPLIPGVLRRKSSTIRGFCIVEQIYGISCGYIPIIIYVGGKDLYGRWIVVLQNQSYMEKCQWGVIVIHNGD
jgi:hypothetical protein